MYGNVVYFNSLNTNLKLLIFYIFFRSENSKGVYCLQYDDQKIVSGLRDNTIKLWNRKTLQCYNVLTAHTGSVLCLQYDDQVCILHNFMNYQKRYFLYCEYYDE